MDLVVLPCFACAMDFRGAQLARGFIQAPEKTKAPHSQETATPRFTAAHSQATPSRSAVDHVPNTPSAITSDSKKRKQDAVAPSDSMRRKQDAGAPSGFIIPIDIPDDEMVQEEEEDQPLLCHGLSGQDFRGDLTSILRQMTETFGPRGAFYLFQTDDTGEQTRLAVLPSTDCDDDDFEFEDHIEARKIPDEGVISVMGRVTNSGTIYTFQQSRGPEQPWNSAHMAEMETTADGKHRWNCPLWLLEGCRFVVDSGSRFWQDSPVWQDALAMSQHFGRWPPSELQERWGGLWPARLLEIAQCDHCKLITTHLGTCIMEWDLDMSLCFDCHRKKMIQKKEIAEDDCPLNCARCHRFLPFDDDDVNIRPQRDDFLWCASCSVEHSGNFTGA